MPARTSPRRGGRRLRCRGGGRRPTSRHRGRAGAGGGQRRARQGEDARLDGHQASATKLDPEPLAPAATVNRVKKAESDFDRRPGGHPDETPVAQASQQFNAAAVALEMSWLRLFSEAGCLTDEQQQQAEAAVRDYTTSLQNALTTPATTRARSTASTARRPWTRSRPSRRPTAFPSPAPSTRQPLRPSTNDLAARAERRRAGGGLDRRRAADADAGRLLGRPRRRRVDPGAHRGAQGLPDRARRDADRAPSTRRRSPPSSRRSPRRRRHHQTQRPERPAPLPRTPARRRRAPRLPDARSAALHHCVRRHALGSLARVHHYPGRGRQTCAGGSRMRATGVSEKRFAAGLPGAQGKGSRGMRKLAAITSIVVGIIMAIAGWSSLGWSSPKPRSADQKITVADDANCAAGDDVNGPISAYCQADIIDHHTLDITGGKTYAELDRDDPNRAVGDGLGVPAGFTVHLGRRFRRRRRWRSCSGSC